MTDRHDQGLSRRRFLTRLALGVSGLSALAAIPGWVWRSPRSADATSQPDTLSSAPETPVVAYVRDAAKGEVVLMVGTKEVIRKDPGLASHLVRSCDASCDV